MEVYVDMCNNVLQLVDKYYEAQPDICMNNGWLEEKNISFYSNYFVKNDKQYESAYRKNLIYNSNNIDKDSDGCYKHILNKLNIFDLLNIMYLLSSSINPSYSRMSNHSSPCTQTLQPPYVAINNAIDMLKSEIYKSKNDDVKNNIDMVSKYNELHSDYMSIKTKYDNIMKIISPK
jgi:hypothetical protein